MTYLHLIESKWDPERKHSTHKFIYSFGKLSELNREKMMALAQNLLRYLNQDITALDMASEILWSRSYGTVFLVEALANKLGLTSLLSTQLKKRNYTSPITYAILAMITNRCMEPLSKLAVEEWIKEDIYFPLSKNLELQHFYRGLDFLEESKDVIEDELFWQTRNLFNRKIDLIFYDTTSTYAEGKAEDDLFNYGLSRDRRPDRKQIVVGLATDRDGLPLASAVFPGNTMDLNTVKSMLKRIDRFHFSRSIFVCDRGMVSDDNLKEIEKAGYEYLVGVKLRGLTEVRDQVLTTPGRFQKIDENLKVKEVMVSNKRYIICLNPIEAEHDRLYREELLKELAQELEGCTLTKKKECSILNHQAKRRLVRKLKDGRLILDKKRIAQESRYDGKYVLLTTERSLKAHELAQQYKHLFQVERAFRTLKTQINLRPLYHYTAHRIKAHVSLCVLAYFLERYAEIKTGTTWEVIRRHMNRISAVKISLKNGTIIKRSQLTNFQKTLLNQLDVKEPPLILMS